MLLVKQENCSIKQLRDVCMKINKTLNIFVIRVLSNLKLAILKQP